jgi:cytochrome c553
MANSHRSSALPARGECDFAEVLQRWLPALAAVVAAALCVAATAAAESAEGVAAGRQKAVQCQACHGLDGLAKIPGAPHLAGQVQEYLVAAMRDYKSGARKNEMMTVVARQLSDEDIDDLAAYYAGLERKAQGER